MPASRGGTYLNISCIPQKNHGPFMLETCTLGDISTGNRKNSTKIEIIIETPTISFIRGFQLWILNSTMSRTEGRRRI